MTIAQIVKMSVTSPISILARLAKLARFAKLASVAPALGKRIDNMVLSTHH